MGEITDFQYCMVPDYTERVERIRCVKHPSKLATDVTNYVLHHISEPIKTEVIAAALFISRSRLSPKFKKESKAQGNPQIHRHKNRKSKAKTANRILVKKIFG